MRERAIRKNETVQTNGCSASNLVMLAISIVFFIIKTNYRTLLPSPPMVFDPIADTVTVHIF
jgi:hypothetical protein